MRTSKKKFYRKRQTASAMAVLLTVLSPGVFPAGIAMAENAGGWIPEGRAGHARVTESNGSVDSSEILEEVWDEEEPEENLATASDAILWSEPATPSDAVQWSEPATPSNLLLLAGTDSGNRRSVGGLERQCEFSGRRNKRVSLSA